VLAATTFIGSLEPPQASLRPPPGTLCIVQLSASPASRTASAPDRPAVLAALLVPAWEEIGRFVLDRKFHSDLHAGAVAELSQMRALRVLAEGAHRMSDLAAELGVVESTATRLLERLVERGLVDRRAVPHDRRCVVAALTAEGCRLVERAEAHRRANLADLLATLEPGERRELVRLLGKVAAELRRRRAGPPGGRP
jgi:DNA-binding MarR family transcriptional regulator